MGRPRAVADGASSMSSMTSSLSWTLSAGRSSRSGEVLGARRMLWPARRPCHTASSGVPAWSDRPPLMPPSWTGSPRCRQATSRSSRWPLVASRPTGHLCKLAEEAVAAVAAGGVQVTSDYKLPDSDVRALQARRGESDYLNRMRITYTGGIDGWVDDCMAMTRPGGFELEAISVPVSVWYGPSDVLSPRAHAEYLLAAIPNAARCELEGGHVLGDGDLDAIYNSLIHS